ncbi:tlde1 domain-containing protein [Bradyrhizobium sp. RDT10]
MNVPATAPKEPEARTAEDKTAKASSGTTVRDMAQRAKAAVMSIASNEKQTMVEKLWGKQPAAGGLLAYASADASVTGSIIDTRSQNPMMGGSPPYDRQTAVYDISAKTVYLPDGTRLEAHSGLGSKMDDVRYSHVRMQGVTPPHIYELKPREALFHGVPALRLTPLGGEEKSTAATGCSRTPICLGRAASPTAASRSRTTTRSSTPTRTRASAASRCWRRSSKRGLPTKTLSRRVVRLAALRRQRPGNNLGLHSTSSRLSWSRAIRAG